MKHAVLFGMIPVLLGGVASAGLASHSHTFTLKNTGTTGVSDARLRFSIDALAVPGEDYFIDNVSLKCGGPELVANGNFGAGQAPWKFYTNAPAPQPTLAIVDGEAVVSFGSDGSNTQLYQLGLQLPAAGTVCTVSFDACSTGGPGNPGYGHNLNLKLAKHTSPFTNYGLDLNGAPPNPDPAADLIACDAGPSGPPEKSDLFPYAEAASAKISPPFVNTFIGFPTPPGHLYYIEQASVTCTTPSNTDVFTQALLLVTKTLPSNATQTVSVPAVVLEKRGPTIFGSYVWTGTANVELFSDFNPLAPDGSGALTFNIFHTDTSVEATCFATLFGSAPPL